MTSQLRHTGGMTAVVSVKATIHVLFMYIYLSVSLPVTLLCVCVVRRTFAWRRRDVRHIKFASGTPHLSPRSRRLFADKCSSHVGKTIVLFSQYELRSAEIGAKISDVCSADITVHVANTVGLLL